MNVMDPGEADWYRSAIKGALEGLGDAEARFEVAYRHRNRADMTGACSQLVDAANRAESWLAENPCPNQDLAFHLKGQITACRRIERAVTSSEWRAGDPEFMDRVDFHVTDLQHKVLWHRDAVAKWASS